VATVLRHRRRGRRRNPHRRDIDGSSLPWLGRMSGLPARARWERADDRTRKNWCRCQRGRRRAPDVVVGSAAQAYLAMAWHLARQHLRFVCWRRALNRAHLALALGLPHPSPRPVRCPPGMPFPDRHLPTKELVVATSTPMQRNSTCRSGSTPGHRSTARASRPPMMCLPRPPGGNGDRPVQAPQPPPPSGSTAR
jgi:hypothetical protein